MNDLGLLRITHILKPSLKFSWFWKKLMICFIGGRKKSSKLKKVIVTKLCLGQKNPKIPIKMKILDKKKHDVLDFWNKPSVMFLDFQK